MTRSNRLGICTVSLGSRFYHDLEKKLRIAAETGHRAIDLYEDDWLVYLSQQPGYDETNPWAPTREHLSAARKIGDLCRHLDLEIVCLQPLINVEGLLDEKSRQWAERYVKGVFPFLREFGTTTVFMTSNRSTEPNVSGDFQLIASDLARFGDWAAEYAAMDGGPMIRIGYEPLSWGTKINTWKDAWQVVKLANRENVGIVFDTFNLLAVEYADPYNSAGHGCKYITVEETYKIVEESLLNLVKQVDGSKIFVVQIADAERMDASVFKRPTDSSIPELLPWSRGHRLYPCETSQGAYLPVADVLAAILATGYKGPLTLEVFNNSLLHDGPNIIKEHAVRGIEGLQTVMKDVEALLPKYQRAT